MSGERGMGAGGGGRHSVGGGRGRNKGGGFGPGGFCVCAKCGKKIPHSRGTKCTDLKCSECNQPLVREELLVKKKTEEDRL